MTILDLDPGMAIFKIAKLHASRNKNAPQSTSVRMLAYSELARIQFQSPAGDIEIARVIS